METNRELEEEFLKDLYQFYMSWMKKTIDGPLRIDMALYNISNIIIANEHAWGIEVWGKPDVDFTQPEEESNE